MKDPGYYTLMVTQHTDKNWKHVSFLYYTKGVMSEDETGFKHINLKVPELLVFPRGHQLIQTTASLNDRNEMWCTLVVQGFHKNITEW